MYVYMAWKHASICASVHIMCAFNLCKRHVCVCVCMCMYVYVCVCACARVHCSTRTNRMWKHAGYCQCWFQTFSESTTYPQVKMCMFLYMVAKTVYVSCKIYAFMCPQIQGTKLSLQTSHASSKIKCWGHTYNNASVSTSLCKFMHAICVYAQKSSVRKTSK